MSILVVNLQDSRAVVRIFIALVRFAFDCPSYFCYISLYIIKRTIVINVQWSPCKIPVTLVGLQLNLNFLDSCSKNTQISNLMKTRPVGAEVFHAVGETDKHDEASSRFSHFCEGAKNVCDELWQLRATGYFH